MTNERIISGIGSILIGMTGLMATGCVTEGLEDEAFLDEVGAVAQEIGTECADAAPTASFVGGINYTSPQTYNTLSCSKGVVVDVSNYSAAYTGPGDIPGQTAVEWADSTASTQAACEGLFLTAYLFRWDTALNDWDLEDVQMGNGSWISFFGSHYCLGPGVAFTSTMQAGQKYRIAASARTSGSSSAPTRKLTIQSREPEIIH